MVKIEIKDIFEELKNYGEASGMVSDVQGIKEKEDSMQIF
jgi:hypothetical protein